MSAIMGIFVALFGVFWTIMAIGMGAGFMAPFGIIFIIISIIGVIYNFKNATSKNRYSSFDIVDQQQEPDPFNERFGNSYYNSGYFQQGTGSEFCPYCGNRVKKEFEFCNKCGKRLPE